MARTYLDWNATAPLRSEAREAMITAMDVIGNPSSVHAEGRAAKSIVEKARRQIASAFGAEASDIVFTSGATEAAALAMSHENWSCADIEHDCVRAWSDEVLAADNEGTVAITDPGKSSLQAANSETGILQTVPSGLALSDAVQAAGKVPYAFEWSGATRALLSAHKFGGPKGVGALIVRKGTDVPASIKGGGQEQGRRSGTENIVGIAGFGAAAEAAVNDLNTGVWTKVEKLRDQMEEAIVAASPGTICVGKKTNRLPNTSCLITPGWKGETQVMQMDLAGYAISAGSACSSGKVKESAVLRAMGFDPEAARSAIRVSLGPTTTEDDAMGFVNAWVAAHSRFEKRAA